MSKNYSEKCIKMDDKEKVTIGYARVSTLRQDLGLEVQKDALKNCDKIFVETESGANNTRPVLTKALTLAKRYSRAGKSVTLVIYKLDRLTRSMFKLLEIINELNTYNIQLISLHERLETNSLIGRLLCMILGFVAENELENLRFRTKEGLRKARENGVKLGAKTIPKSKEKNIVHLYLNSKLSLRQIAKAEQISTSTIYQVLKRNNISNNRQKSSHFTCCSSTNMLE